MVVEGIHHLSHNAYYQQIGIFYVDIKINNNNIKSYIIVPFSSLCSCFIFWSTDVRQL